MRHRIRRLAAGAIISAFVLAAPATAAERSAPSATDETPIVLAQAGTEPGELDPRYHPVEPEPQGFYNGSYIFGITRALTDSTIAPAGKAPLFLFTIPLDLALLPIAVIGGFFG